MYTTWQFFFVFEVYDGVMYTCQGNVTMENTSCLENNVEAMRLAQQLRLKNQYE